MFIGLKVVPQTAKERVSQLVDLFDFIEVYAGVGHEFDYLLKYDKEVVIHCQHSADGTNFCDASKVSQNVKSLDWAKRLADKFRSSKIIIHPEYVDSRSCSLENLISFIQSHYDERMLIETMPFFIGELGKSKQCLCYDIGEIKKVCQEVNIGFCLDLNHSAGSALHRNIAEIAFIKQLIELKPKHYHISDVDHIKGDEVHKNLFDGTLDVDKIKSTLPTNASVTLETPPNTIKQIDEVNFLRQTDGKHFANN